MYFQKVRWPMNDERPSLNARWSTTHQKYIRLLSFVDGRGAGDIFFHACMNTKNPGSYIARIVRTRRKCQLFIPRPSFHVSKNKK
jgi:hypothetical protein